MSSQQTGVESLKARLDICKRQLEGNSVLNTSMRKDALRTEIHTLETAIARALGLNDDEDNSDVDSEADVKREHNADTPTTFPSPSLNNLSATRSPSPILMNLKAESGYPTPPKSSQNNSPPETSSSSGPSSLHSNELESVFSALNNTDEGDLDLETLLKEQSMMEQRLADLKRKREEEDEALARSLHEEEVLSLQSRGILINPFTSSATSSSTSINKSILDSRMDRARQEREDEEMAKIFAESEASASINLTSSSSASSSTSTSLPVFQIFEKRPKIDTIKSSVNIPQTLLNSSNTKNQVLSATGWPTLGIPSTSTNPDIRSLNHAAAILASVNQSGGQKSQLPTPNSSQQTPSQPKTVDLTKPTIDLTKTVHEISSSDDEVEYVSSSQRNCCSYHRSLDRQGAHPSSSVSFNSSYFDSDDEEGWDSDGDSEELLRSLSRWESEMLNGWTRRHDGRNYDYGYGQSYGRTMSTAETEKELRALLANIQASEEDIPPQDRTGTPDGMASNITLLEHQKIGLTWLQKMESGTNKGGILGDDMGLGKTIQSMALIVSRPSGPIDDPVIWDDNQKFYASPPESMLVKTKATLILAPVSLIYQWAEEIKSKTEPGLLKVYIYHGKDRFNDPELMRRYDVIISTTSTLANEMGVNDPHRPSKQREIGALFKIHFHRIIIDEAHLIKNKITKAARACAGLSATYRWCLTGTPIQNNIDELFSLIRFLKIKPYCEWDEFRDKISTPMKKSNHQYGRAMERVQALLKAICLRRTKTSTVDGKPILNLPERKVEKLATEFSLDERAFYEALETRTRERFNAYVKAGTVMKNYSNILVLLLRLRQACCHPHLINDFEKVDETATGDVKAHVDRLLDNLMEDIRLRLIERGLDAVECPICMDVGEESVILSGCGHIYCRACIIAHLSRHEEDDRKCPECRRISPIDNLISIADFNARFIPEVPEDPKGKGKAVDEFDNLDDKLPDVDIPVELNDWISSSKIDKMIGIVRSVIAKGEKIIVFSQFSSLLNIIERPLKDEGIRFLRYDGTMRPEKRDEAVRTMTNDPTYPLMLISLKCGSLGLNLVSANHVVLMDPWWNPSLENQAIDRVHRIGQTRNVSVHRLCIPNTVEDRILALQEKKKALADGALGEGEVPKLAKLGLQELMYLFRGV
ncbi:hypothetical protein BGZ76_001426 [Entomortierella beljakovae]|nr:hypothetical protein BGZ76_001426 [Entomortierella beljakovae]